MAPANPQQAAMALAFEPLNSRVRLKEGLETGAYAVLPLVLVHGFLALSGLFTGQGERLLVHGGLTGLAVLAAVAIVKGRTVWPSLIVLAWLGIEILGGKAVFNYPAGGLIFNWAGVPLAILGVRASFRRRAVSSGRHQPLPAVTLRADD